MPTSVAKPKVRVVSAVTGPPSPELALETAAAAPRYPTRVRVGVISSAGYLVLLLIAVLAPSWLAGGDPLDANARQAFLGADWNHPLGTDENGRDLLARLVYGTRPSLLMGLGASAIGLVLGTALGLAAGLGHRAIDAVVMGLTDVLLAFPELLLALVIITFWGQGISSATIAVGIASVPRYARLVRAQSRIVLGSTYVEAARTLGAHPLKLLYRHILPNSIRPVLVLAAIGIGGKIAAGASLSFLGFGVAPPSPEWGAMLSVGRHFLANAWWLTAAPALAITLTVMSITTLGRELRRRVEGRTS